MLEVFVVFSETAELHRVGYEEVVGEALALLARSDGTLKLDLTDDARDGQIDAASSKTPAAAGEMMEYASAHQW